MRLFACFLALAWLIPTTGFAQVDLVDPDAPSVKKKKSRPAPQLEDGLGEPDAPGSTETVADDPSDGDLVAPPTKKQPAGNGKKGAGGKDLPKEQPKAEPPPKKEPPPMVVKTISDSDLNAVWLKWRQANASRKADAEQAARKELLAMRSLVGSSNMELWAVGLLRAAQTWEAAGDSGAAVEIAVTASELAPDLPATWFLLTRLYFSADPSGIPRYLGSLQKGITTTLSDSRYLRPLVADLSSIALLAFIATIVVVMLVLLLRRGYYFLYDFHFFFPRAAARWQTSALAILLLSLPIVFRMGVAPTLLAFFAAITMYLTVRERVLAVVLIGSLGLVPIVGGFVVEHTAFAETAAEDLYEIERGGQGIEPLVQRYEKLAAEDKVGFAERFVLGHFYLNRGHLEQAVDHLKRALSLRPDDVPGKVALAKAFFLQGDLENSRSMLENVKATAPSSVAFLDLARVYQRRVQVYGDSNAGEIDKANQNLMEARQLDATLPSIDSEDPLKKEIIGNDRLRTLPLTQDDLVALAKGEVPARRGRSQLSQILVGDVPEAVAPFYPALVALLLLAFGFLGKSLEAAKVCNRCGRPVSRRGDPDVSAGSPMCTQCVNVFAKKNVVAPSVKVRKQLEVARYESQMERASTILGVLWSGMGHVFSGAPVQGAVYGYLFVLAITGVVLRSGVVRAPFEGIPVGVRLVPLVLLFLIIYPLSLLRLRRSRS
jgi:tetratricopeptide (TPR) repeat protein